MLKLRVKPAMIRGSYEAASACPAAGSRLRSEVPSRTSNGSRPFGRVSNFDEYRLPAADLITQGRTKPDAIRSGSAEL